MQVLHLLHVLLSSMASFKLWCLCGRIASHV